MPTPLKVAWGKFRNHQRTLPEPGRLTRPQLRGAWAVWDRINSEQGNPADVVLAAAQGCTPDELAGANAFARWVTANLSRLKATVHRVSDNKAHTTDGATAMLIRDDPPGVPLEVSGAIGSASLAGSGSSFTVIRADGTHVEYPDTEGPDERYGHAD